MDKGRRGRKELLWLGMPLLESLVAVHPLGDSNLEEISWVTAHALAGEGAGRLRQRRRGASERS